MNSKKITALALAALMAVGSTGTAFATVNGEALDFGSDKNLYKENGDGVLVEAEADEFAPGDDIYIRLEEAEDLTSKDAKKMNLYATWKVGEENVEDLDIVYTKGLYEDEKNYAVSGYEYTLSANGTSLDGKKIVVSGAEIKDLSTLKEELKKTEVLSDAVSADYARTSGAVVAGKYYADDKIVDFLKALNWKQMESKKENMTITGKETGYGTYATGGTDTLEVKDIYVDPNASGGAGSYVDVSKITTISALADAGFSVEGWMAVTAEAPAYALEHKGDVATKEVAENNLLNAVTSFSSEAVTVADDGYTYWAKISTKDSDTTKTLDLAGDLFIGRSKSSADGKDESAHFALDLTLSNRGNADNGYDYDIEVVDDAPIGVDERAVLKFSDDAEDVTLEFGDEIARYEFNAKGQKALNFAFNLDFNKEIAALFPEANLDFITWTAKPSTNKTGTLYIYADEDSFLYEVTDNGIKEVNGAKYDEDEGAWVVRTRKLSAYAIADQELDANKVIEEEKETSSSTESESNNSGKHNPDTGR